MTMNSSEEVQSSSQEPVAIIGFGCRLPGGNSNPQKLWEFLERGGVAANTVPESRFNINGHYDGSLKPGTMRPKGGMFLSDEIDLATFDAGFFEVSGADATAMDPNQRQMLEVVYEALENSGITLEQLDGEPVACYVGSYATDYLDMQNRDAEDRPPNILIGTGRAVLSNRISYFLNIKGPSITIDTACSGSLVGLDLACRALQAGEVNMAIVAASNLYLNPDHVMDMGSVGQAHSPTALCHTFDADADGYVKAEAVGSLIVKRLSDAIRDNDPIRAVVRGTAQNSNGRTKGVGGIAAPNAVAQAAAIRSAYANAGISNFADTAYLECHGTGTPTGDPIEVRGAASVFSSTRDSDRPLLIGSIKSNVGHSEPAAGISGLIKLTMAMEKGIIPGNPTFLKPSPKINFLESKVRASRTSVPWPDKEYSFRRGSINSFGYGGSNAHAVLEAYPNSSHVSSYRLEDEDSLMLSPSSSRPYTLLVSANDATALEGNISALVNHLSNPGVTISLPDLAYTLSERRSRLWHQAFVTVDQDGLETLDENDFVVAKRLTQAPKIGLVFTGQGAQSPEMGKELLKLFPQTRAVLEELDSVLQAQPDPPAWSLVDELSQPRTAEHLRQPEFSQPLVTALQLAILSVLESWGVQTCAAVGHSSGEIAAAYAAGLLDRAGAIKAAFYRGRAAINRKEDIDKDVGMLAVGLGFEAVSPFLEKYQSADPGPSAWVACLNSPSSVTISGNKPVLEKLAEDIKAAGHFARLLQVDLAYHSPKMGLIGEEYCRLLEADKRFKPLPFDSSNQVTMFSSVTASQKTTLADAQYWTSNMVSPVRFAEATKQLVAEAKPDMLLEIGPSGALAGPVSQVLKDMKAKDVHYQPAWSRGAGAAKTLLNIAGRLSVSGAPIDMGAVNGGYEAGSVRTIVDLPNYRWNHSARYWHENAASAEWRTKRFITHDLLGSKVPGTTWKAPTWRHNIHLADVPWLRDHKMGPDVLIPGTGFVAMAVEAMFQKYCSLHPEEAVVGSNDLAYRLRNIKFDRAAVVEEEKPTSILLTLSNVPGSNDWHEFRVRTTAVPDVVYEHCSGLIRVQEPLGADSALHGEELAPLHHPQPAAPWYKVQTEIGTSFGPSFQKIKQWESVSGQHHCRAIMSLEPPPSKWDPQSHYPIHPAVLDACLQTSTPAILAGERSTLKDVMVLASIDDIVVNKVPRRLHDGLSVASAAWTGRGRKDKSASWATSVAIHDPDNGALYLRVRGLHHVRLDVEEKPDPHVFQAVHWKPDISLLTQDQLLYMAPCEGSTSRLDDVIDLIAHKTPRLSVLEINFDDADSSSLWFETGISDTSRAARAAFVHYDFASPNAQSLVTVEAANSGKQNAHFHLLGLSRELLGLPESGHPYDLVILKVSTRIDKSMVDGALEKIKTLLKPSTFTLKVVHGQDSEEVISDDGTPETLSRDESESNSQAGSQDIQSFSSATSSSGFQEIAEKSGNGPSYTPRLMQIPARPGTNALPAYLYINGIQNNVAVGSQPSVLVVARFDDKARPLTPNLQAVLEASGWTIKITTVEDLANHARTNGAKLLSDSSAVLVVDELAGPVLSSISQKRWEALKQLIASGKPILWVTKGAQTAHVIEPENAMVQGLFRVARREDPGAALVTLDVQSPASVTTHWAIDRVLEIVRSGAGPPTETEYAERDGVLQVSRIMPDEELNIFKAAELGVGLEQRVQGLHATEAQVRLQADKIGTLQSLTWCETAVGEVPVEVGKVEVEVRAVGVNFKDVATTMGIVPENEHTIGCECAGYIKRLGPGVTKFKVGDRVVAQTSGTYVNRLQCPTERVYAIPDSMSYEDAATIPLVYLTAIYSLFHLANLREGQSVLIHSATGGVGLAAIQLAQYKKADIFVTVGTEEKRKFLASHFGIPANRMFSSRNTKFAEEIRRETGGRGVDVILNSLIGELLDESWRLTADGGIMVEIGKRDIVDRNTLAMEPFDRNCSFRAVDLSYVREISDDLIASLLKEVFDLVEAGHVGPIHPITVYPFEQVIPALSYIRRGVHMGKIVVSSGEEEVQLPIRPATPKLSLKPDVAYLIVGGLKGLCGNLAVYMAIHGARHIISMSRSGIDDEASARVVANCASYGCEVTSAQGDVADVDFVSDVFRSARPRKIAGVIQGAMVLRDKPYEMMTHDDYTTAIHAKVAGTWNLHHAAQQEQKQPLDFFTMLSSISGVVGNKGQANYAAANAFLDAFAHYRQAQGLHAHTVDLGLIEDVGYVAEVGGASLEARFDPREWTSIKEGMLRRIFQYSVLQQDGPRVPISGASSAQLVTGITYPLHADVSDLAEDRRFGYLFNSSAGAGDVDDGGADKDSGEQAIRAFRMMHSASTASPGEVAQAAVALLQVQISKLLRLGTDLEPGKPLMAYGLDSLSAVELRGWVRQKLGAELSTLDITNASSLVALCEKLVAKMPPPAGAAK